MNVDSDQARVVINNSRYMVPLPCSNCAGGGLKIEISVGARVAGRKQNVAGSVEPQGIGSIWKTGSFGDKRHPVRARRECKSAVRIAVSLDPGFHRNGMSDVK